MRFEIDIRPEDIHSGLRWFADALGGAIKRRIQEVENECRRRPTLLQCYQDMLALEFTAASLLREMESGSTTPRGDKFDDINSFVFGLFRLQSSLSREHREQLLKRVTASILKDRYGLRPFAHEVRTIVHLISRGFDVELVDLTGQERFDFLATKDGHQIEVECKTSSFDAGRKIHRLEFHRIAEQLLSATKALALHEGHHVIRVEVPDRLSGDNAVLLDIVSVVKQVVSCRESRAGYFCRVDYISSSGQGWPSRDVAGRPESLAYLHQRLGGFRHRHALWHGHVGNVAIVVESRKPDKVIDSLTEQVKGAADQLSGTRPSLIALQLMEIEPKALKGLIEESSGLHHVASAVFDSGTRFHVNSIIYSLHASDETETTINTRQRRGIAAILYNSSPKFPSVIAKEAFRP